MSEHPKKTISILVPSELHEELNKLAEGASRSMSSYIRQVLRAHLEYLGRFRRR